MPRIDGSKCVSCALPLHVGSRVPEFPGSRVGETGELGNPGTRQPMCLDCQLDPLPVDWCDAWGRYSGTLEALLGAFKFRHHDFLDDAFAGLLDDVLTDRAFDALVPVPMHRTKERRRGYNQAELLARALARRTGIPCELLLTKREERGTQSTLDRKARAANVRGLFEASPRADGRAILLIDDICTTGETLRACATELLRRGAARVCAITVAKAT